MPIPGGNSQLAAGGMNAAGTTYQKEQNIQDDAENITDFAWISYNPLC